jgi:hypothetical protein
LGHACFGLRQFGLCDYDPAKPYSIYFAPGAAVGALAFTLAAQQLLKPVHRFHLRTRHLTLARIYICVFGGVAATIVAAILPNVSILHGGPWGYPINWEIMATALFVVAYSAVVLAIIRPVRVRPVGLPDFAQYAASLLSLANEEDHIAFADDLECALPTLIEVASFIDPLRDTSAFFDFIHRKELERASYASSFLRIVADPPFCETLVKRLPWRIVFMLRKISEDHLHANGAEQFVRELAYQAILRDDGMMAREVGYHGFGTAPLLSESLFSDWFIIEQYNPFNSFFAVDSKIVTPQMLKRFNSAAERCFTTLIESGTLHRSQAAFSIQRFYQTVFMRAWEIQKTDEHDFHLPLEMHYSVNLAIKMADKLLASLNANQFQALYADNLTQNRFDVLETLVEIVYESLAAISNRFKGADDPFWMTAIEVFLNGFPPHGQEPDGMTPFQQRLALKLIKKLEDNMKGWYPAICRVLLACVGPYQHQAPQPNRTAFNIFKDAVYYELQKFPQLAATKPDKVADYLPDNVTYDATTTELVQTYRGGAQAVTRLSTLNLQPISLVAQNVRR